MKLLRALRNDAGLKQKDVAKSLGLETSTYTKYETEPRYPAVEMLKKISDFYKFPIDFMIYHPDAEPSSDEIRIISRMGLGLSDADPQISAITEKAKQLNAQGLTRLEQYADDLLAADIYRKKKTPLAIAARGGNVVQPDHPIDVDALERGLSGIEPTDNL